MPKSDVSTKTTTIQIEVPKEDEVQLLRAAKKAVQDKIEDIGKDEVNDKAAQDVFRIYSAYQRAGFTDEQAFKLVSDMAAGLSMPRPY